MPLFVSSILSEPLLKHGLVLCYFEVHCMLLNPEVHLENFFINLIRIEFFTIHGCFCKTDRHKAMADESIYS